MTPEQAESAARAVREASVRPDEPLLLGQNSGSAPQNGTRAQPPASAASVPVASRDVPAAPASAAPARGADSRLADSLNPQMGLAQEGEFHVEVVQAKPPGLADKFVVPPFTVLDTRQAYWIERRRAWMTLGLRGETTSEQPYSPGGGRKPPGGVYQDAHGRAQPVGSGGRKQELTYGSSARTHDPAFYDKKAAVELTLGRELTTAEFERDHYRIDEQELGDSQSMRTGTSVFDPVLCEVAYRWFSPLGGQVLDPFAGGAVRGVLAGALGRRYVGVELRPEQITDNRSQANTIFGEGGVDFGREVVTPEWVEGDATELGEYSLPKADMVMTCPPYCDLECYSDDPRDLSTMTYDKFSGALYRVMKGSADLLKDDRFAVWVVGEARDKNGDCYRFVSDTVQIAALCGLALVNEAILVNSVGSAALRAQKIVRAGRKLVRVHQHVFVFAKGSSRKAAEACGTMDVDL